MSSKKVKSIVIFIVVIALAALWLFKPDPSEREIGSDEDMSSVVSSAALTEEEARSEEKENADLEFYYYVREEGREVVEEYITLDKSLTECTFSKIVNRDIENVTEAKGAYAITGNKIHLYLHEKEYAGTVENDKMILDNKIYYREEDGYI